ncbi:hypothetical protein BDU57DRAFT_574535, partial [Ampelomyces quisqualis]
NIFIKPVPTSWFLKLSQPVLGCSPSLPSAPRRLATSPPRTDGGFLVFLPTPKTDGPPQGILCYVPSTTARSSYTNTSRIAQAMA